MMLYDQYHLILELLWKLFLEISFTTTLLQNFADPQGWVKMGTYNQHPKGDTHGNPKTIWVPSGKLTYL